VRMSGADAWVRGRGRRRAPVDPARRVEPDERPPRPLVSQGRALDAADTGAHAENESRQAALQPEDLGRRKRIHLEDRGAQELKGVPGLWNLYVAGSN
jgi:hypothetical protein